MNSLVSIIMPAYNAERYIKEAIHSVLSQTYANWELLIINDGSQDSTQQVIDGYNDDRIKKFQQENKGVSAARNLGLKNMTGAFFCFLDADDVIPRDSIESRVLVFKDSSIDFVDGIVEKRGESMFDILEVWTPKFEGEPLADLVRLTGNSFFGPSWMIRKRQVGTLFREGLTHGEDLLFYIESALKGGRYTFVDRTVLQYRVHSISAMSDLDKLGLGYVKLKQLLLTLDIDSKLVKVYSRKIKTIMFKSYLNRFQFLKAFRYLFCI